MLSCHFWSHVIHGLEVIECDLGSALDVANLIVKDQIYLVDFVDRALDTLAVSFHINSFHGARQQVACALDP